MTGVKVHDKYFETYLSEDTILQRIKEMAAAINKDYAGKRPFLHRYLKRLLHVCIRPVQTTDHRCGTLFY